MLLGPNFVTGGGDAEEINSRSRKAAVAPVLSPRQRCFLAHSLC